MRIRTVTIGLGAAGLAAYLSVAGTPVARADSEKEAWFEQIDTDHDGKISADEWAAGHKEVFSKMDTNGDGKVSPDEMKAAKEKREKMMGKSGGHEMMSVTETMKIMDLNGDGYITEDEFVTASKTKFDKMDTDHDGYLTKAELKAGHEKMKSNMGKSEKSQPQEK